MRDAVQIEVNFEDPQRDGGRTVFSVPSVHWSQRLHEIAGGHMLLKSFWR